MSKPVVFFSHSSRDGEALGRLKARFVAITGGTIDVFLSSDGQSIRLGRNWVSSVEQGLDAAALMFAFVTPNSVASSWLYFESGVAYARKIDVVPVGLFGVNIGDIAPPLSLLQGFNATGHNSLNNLVTKVNETFSHRHLLGFTLDDFMSLQSAGPLGVTRMFGEHAARWVRSIYDSDTATQPAAKRSMRPSKRSAFN